MNEAEMSAWLGQFRKWLDSLHKIDSPGAQLNEIFQEGLPLLRIFPYCRNFVDETLRVKDYHRRITQLRRLAAKVTAEVEKSSGHLVNYRDPALLKPHVGRPTKAEAIARALHEKEQREADRKAPNIFNIDGKDDEGPVVVPAVFTPTSPKGRTISEISWILSPQMQTEAANIRVLRAHFEEECTIAKQMAEDGRSSEDIAPHTAAAARYCDLVEGIYQRIDHELCVAYVRLKEDTAYIAEMSKKSRYDNKELRTLLRPYWDKLSTEGKEMYKNRVISEIKHNDPAQAADREQQEIKKRKVQSILKYFRRTDRALTAKRIKTMEEKMSELRQLIGEDADKYMPLLESARREFAEKTLSAPQSGTKKA